MAVIGPRKSGAPHAAPPGADGLSRLESALLQAGLAKTPAEARVLAQKLLAGLARVGIAPPAGTLFQQVQAQLVEFQRGVGLPATGVLDEKTLGLLQERGLLPRPDADRVRGVAPGPDPSSAPGRLGWQNFVPSAPGAQPLPGALEGPPARAGALAIEAAAARAHHRTEEPLPSLKDLLGRLQNAGFAGAGSGRQRLTSSLIQFQAQSGLAQTGKLDRATVSEMVRRGWLPAGSETLVGVHAGPGAREADGGELRATSMGQAESVSSTAPGVNSAAPMEGRGDVGPRGAGDAGDVALGDDARNAPAGDDEAQDPRRGHSSVGQDEVSDEGYWEMPPLSMQIAAALEEIVKNNDDKGAATYRWDVTFYRPGTYGRRQPAEALWHVVVEHASPFDPVWEEARHKLTGRLLELEPDARPLASDDFQRALRRARVRDTPAARHGPLDTP